MKPSVLPGHLLLTRGNDLEGGTVTGTEEGAEKGKESSNK
jgi:hypothetical protein